MSDIDPKEKLLIEFVLSNHDLFVKCNAVLQPEYFEAPLDEVVRFSINYFKKYHNIPDTSIVHAETGVKLKSHEIEKAEFDYITDEVEKHCQESAMALAIIEGSNILADTDDEGKPDMGKIQNLVRDALMVSIDKDLGTRYFEDPLMRLMGMQQHLDARTTGWVSYDMIIGKAKRTEFQLFAGGTGSGKSIILSNITANFAAQGLNCLYISLELGEDLISQRIDGIITGIPVREVFDDPEAVEQSLNTVREDYGNIVIKRMPVQSNANNFRSYLIEYEIQYGYKPDVICVDYLDLMGTNEKVQGNAFDVDKAKAEELREIFEDYNAYGFSASQLNRDAVDTAVKSQAHIAGGISKLNTVDVGVAIIRNEEQRDNHEIHLQLIKLRNAEFSSEPIALHWDDKTLKISDITSNTSGAKKQTQGNKKKVNDRLQKIMEKRSKK